MVRSTLPHASRADTLGFLVRVIAPTLAKGPIIRRKTVAGLSARLDLERGAVLQMQQLSDRYGPGPLFLRLPGRPRAIILETDHLARVLGASPDPFAPGTSEKRAALAHFEPQGVLISRGKARSDRRDYSEAVLESHQPLHHLAVRFVEVVEEEMRGILPPGDRVPLDWDTFSPAFFRIVRRVILGDGARYDLALTDTLAELRKNASWAMLHPDRRRVRERFFLQLEGHLARAEPLSLAGVMARTPASHATAPSQQVPQWLFAFDAVGMATFRALALLASHPDAEQLARTEVAGSTDPAAPLPFVRAVLLESLRLWPTTPLVLRETTDVAEWEAGRMPAGTSVVIYAPYFHRDSRRLAFADRLYPEVWTRPGEADTWPLIPFSRGPAGCPGRQLALLVGSAILAAVLRRGPLTLLGSRPPLHAATPLPAGLDPFTLRFALS